MHGRHSTHASTDTFPPKMQSPSTSGGFYKYPKKDRTVEAFSSLQLGPSSQLIDLNPLCPGSRAVREETGVNFMYKRYNPIADDRLENLRAIRTASPGLDRQLISRPSLVTSFSGVIDYAGDPNIIFEDGGMISRSTQTQAPLVQLEIESISHTQKWTKETVEPFLKELRQNIFAQKPEDLKEFIMAYCVNKINQVDPPITVLPPDPDDPEDQADAESALVVKGKRKKKKNKKNMEMDEEKVIPVKPTQNKVTGANAIIKVRIDYNSEKDGLKRTSTMESSQFSNLSRGGSSVHLNQLGMIPVEEVVHQNVPRLPDLARLSKEI